MKKKTSRPPRSKPDTNAGQVEGQQTGNETFPVVGVGASAGGLEAFKQLLAALPVDTGMAFVLVTHLDPTHESILTELLARATEMPVAEVEDGVAVAPNHVYVIPRNTSMAIEGGVLRLRPREEGRGQHRPIDSFLHTLAEDQNACAIGVILSGTATDGTLGLEAIKAEGGITFAQDAKSAKYDSMPRSAIAAGCVDFILTPEEIAKELARINRHPYVASVAAAKPPDEEQPAGRNGFNKILALLRRATGVDFSLYKANTLHRRITRRMILNKLDGLEDYAQRLRENAAEVENLYQDILINVTSFFRHPETFEVLKEKIFPQIVEHQTPGEPLRIWVLGCSTGEEAYSIAMAFSEFAGERSDHIPIQIFATDLNEKGIEHARAGLYSKNITEDVSPERLRRFFTEADGGYRVSKPLRDMCVFARQNVTSDPPFSRMDLISCRNLMIYLEPVLQKRVLPLLHYALRPAGVLWLGSSETTGAASDLFEPAEKKHRFYARKATTARPHLSYPTGGQAREKDDAQPVTARVERTATSSETDAQREADRIILARYGPASALINEDLNVLQLRGDTAPYLEQPPGKATRNLLKMAREGLLVALRAAVNRARKDESPVRKENLRVKYDGATRDVNLEVIPLKHPPSQERHFLALFEIAEAKTEGSGQKAGGGKQKAEERQIRQLHQELAAARDYLQSVVEEHEAANEELQSASEEVQSSNEELQSINEELETAKEELESSNEELTTVNEELNNRNAELGRLNSDLVNLLGSVQMPILMLDSNLRIRRITPMAEKLLKLIRTDVGRPIGDLKLNIDCPDLEQLIAEVIDTVSIREGECQDTAGRWYSLRIHPYKTLDNKIDGAVVVLVDIDALKQTEREIEAARDYAEAVLRTARDPLIVLHTDLRVDTANDAFYKTFKVTPDQTEGRLIYDLGNRQWDIPRLRQLLEEIIPRNSFFNDYEVTHEVPGRGKRTMLLNARRLDNPGGGPERILLGIDDVTERQRLDESVRRSEERFRALTLASAQVVWMANADGLVEEDSPSWRAFTGQTFEQWQGWGWLDALHPDDREATRKIWSDSVASQSICVIEYRLRRADGAYRWTTVRAVPVLNTDGSIREWIGMNTDIAERKQAEEALRQRTQQFETLFNQAPVGIYLVDADFRIRLVNPTARPVFGDIPDLIGRDFDEVIHILWSLEYADEIVRLFRHTLETGEPYVTPERIEQRRDRGVTEYYQWQIHRILPPDGRYCVVCYFEDISAQVQAREKIQESEERFRSLVSVITDVPWTTDAEGAFTTPQPAWEAYTGQSWEEHRGVGWANALYADDRERVKALWLAAIESRTLYQSDGRVWHAPSRQWRYFTARATPLLNADGSVREWVGTCTDVEEQKRAELERQQLLIGEQAARAEAETANRLKDEFLATLSHELRTPLNSILGWTRMLRNKQQDEATLAHAMEVIERSARAQNQLITDLLEVSRIITGKLRLDASAVELLPVIEAALDVVHPAAEAKHIELSSTLDPASGLVTGDADRLQQIIWNLLSNAVKFTPKEGRIEVRLEREGTHVRVTVSDSGEGISAEFLPHVFDRFSQADGTSTRAHGGLGLGLAIVRHLVELHGGTVHAGSEGKGQGSTFTVRLPLRAAGQGDKETGEHGDNPLVPLSPLPLVPLSLQGVRVLVVDDEADSRDLLSYVLRKYGAEMRGCATAAEALRMLDEWQPDVLVSDIGMPGEDGYDLMRKVRARAPERGGQVPAVALTGYARAEDERRVRAAGFQMHIPKPVELDDLAAAVASLAGRDGEVSGADSADQRRG